MLDATGNNHVLPFERLSALDFERLCYGLADRLGYTHLQHLGASGSDDGADIEAIDPKGRRTIIQCKRVQRLSLSALKNEIDKMRRSSAGIPATIIFACSCSVSARTRTHLNFSITDVIIQFWDLTFLDNATKKFPCLVSDFFQLPNSRPLYVDSTPVYLSYHAKIEFDLQKCKYHFTICRDLSNTTNRPITQDMHYIWCNKYPGSPDKSAILYSKTPLNWNELEFRSWDDDGPFEVELQNCFGSRIDHFILFKSGRWLRPINPGTTRRFYYSYSIPAKLFGSFYDRFIHFPMHEVRIELSLPAICEPVCWGYIQPQTSIREPIVPAIKKSFSPCSQFLNFTWSSRHLVQGYSYGLEWSGNHPDW